MATLTIRDLDESLKQSLRVRAAHRNRSMEEEARQILRAALQGAPAPGADLAQRIRARLVGLGDVQLPLAVREPIRTPPTLLDIDPPRRKNAGRPSSRAKPASAAKRGTAR